MQLCATFFRKNKLSHGYTHRKLAEMRQTIAIATGRSHIAIHTDIQQCKPGSMGRLVDSLLVGPECKQTFLLISRAAHIVIPDIFRLDAHKLLTPAFHIHTYCASPAHGNDSHPGSVSNGYSLRTPFYHRSALSIMGIHGILSKQTAHKLHDSRPLGITPHYLG